MSATQEPRSGRGPRRRAPRGPGRRARPGRASWSPAGHATGLTPAIEAARHPAERPASRPPEPSGRAAPSGCAGHRRCCGRPHGSCGTSRPARRARQAERPDAETPRIRVPARIGRADGGLGAGLAPMNPKTRAAPRPIRGRPPARTRPPPQPRCRAQGRTARSSPAEPDELAAALARRVITPPARIALGPGRAQPAIAIAPGPNSRDGPLGARSERTGSTIRRRNSGGQGGLVHRIPDTPNTSANGSVQTGQLQGAILRSIPVIAARPRASGGRGHGCGSSRPPQRPPRPRRGAPPRKPLLGRAARPRSSRRRAPPRGAPRRA